MNLGAVADDRPETGLDLRGNGDVLGEGAADNAHDFLDDFAGVEGDAFAIQAAAKSEDLLDDAGAAFNADFDAVDGFFLLFLGKIPAQVPPR